MRCLFRGTSGENGEGADPASSGQDLKIVYASYNICFASQSMVDYKILPGHLFVITYLYLVTAVTPGNSFLFLMPSMNSSYLNYSE